MDKVQCLVVGAGVVGLACARALSRSGREVVLVDVADSFGAGTSSRNSEVVHAGIYYPQNSLKAIHCVRGAESLLAYCRERGVAHRQCGKLIVATHVDQHAQLAAVKSHAYQNGVDLRPLTPADVLGIEPEVRCTSALHSPRTAIVDSHTFMEALLADAEDSGTFFVRRTRVAEGGRILNSGSNISVSLETLDVNGEVEGIFNVEAEEVINCAGLAAPSVAARLGLPAAEIPAHHFCKGNYYALQGAGRPFNGLVYPIPEQNTDGLGVHATVDLAGNVRFGPDVQWLPDRLESGEAVDEVATRASGGDAASLFRVDIRRADGFYQSVRRYWPGLPDSCLVASYSGIRPKLTREGEAAKDFVIQPHYLGSTERPAAVSLFGIESPGLTASISLASAVLKLLQAK
mmetsp:Transcript_14640/g.31671  ORF Transcript_14640/g.31671 Transcript_14640/m.31671 type:complete len:403 (+) Transcript_14640:142-1350(+)|eukprot:CAMPEP_0206421808 /NCGR_PEP_ID=MMETSP0324_2-20121206/1672_1 /ASSEMBLY_ACC=CAM_ASM_000836 /TAXON_ID=2866 /ORGANISM="Crypthecodinium cohnii, Strain Seligo" /LENGTH=402 /DNA_ID=CAMNT_0053885981 /DNA_START=71 /DNA_END=1279 /DNA_ORIENTATION=+